jgi:hypothetical protein
MFQLVERLSHMKHPRKEKEMDKIDVERTHTNVLQESAHSCILGKRVLIIAEEHKHHQQEQIHRRCSRQVCPLELQCMPFQNVGTAKEAHNNHKREEPVGIEKTLPTVPVSANNIAEDKEMEIPHRLDQTAVMEERILMVVEPRRHIDCGIDA